MSDLTVICYEDTEAWWADVPDLKGFSAAAPDLVTLKVEVRNGLSFALDGSIPRLRFVSEHGVVLDATPPAAVLERVG